MNIEDLGSLPTGTVYRADVIVIGAGAAGITLAREFSGTKTQVIVLESGGRHESESTCGLNAVDASSTASTAAQIAKREAFHGQSAPLWSHKVQPYGVRYRGLGGSTQAWAGKSSVFDEIDFADRDWIKHSGWPISLASLAPYLERAGRLLNLGPLVNDGELWNRLGSKAAPPWTGSALRSYFWQFARSRLNSMDIMRFGSEFARDLTPNIRFLINATAHEILVGGSNPNIKTVVVSAADGRRYEAQAPYIVLAASTIENARLLLASKSQSPEGLGNGSGMVGRYLMDHPGCRIAHFDDPKTIVAVKRKFGFYAFRDGQQTSMYMHGLAIDAVLQKREHLANGALYMMELRAEDDPWTALKRVLKRESVSPVTDLYAIVRNVIFLVNGLGRKILQHRFFPDSISRFVVDLVIRFNPDFAATEFRFGGLPHKLTGLAVDAIVEQRPDPDNRVTLSTKTDRFGFPLARVEWRVSDESKRDLINLARILKASFIEEGLPVPTLEDWVEKNDTRDAVIIDMAHSAGTTRMSLSAADGVVDRDCKLHNVDGVYVAGASVFPTSGHANPTLMICTMAVRLADHIKDRIAIDTKPPAEIARLSTKTEDGSLLVLVTGATGNIGRVLVGTLIEAGFRVRGQYALTPGPDRRVDWYQSDFNDVVDFDALLAGCDAVIHLAGELRNTDAMERINVDATKALARAAQRQGIRYFGNASSMVVYGSPVDRTVTETSPVINPLDPIVSQYYADAHMCEYARTKVLGETAIYDALRDNPTSVTRFDIYRISVVANIERMQEAFNWPLRRRFFALYRRTQYIYDQDIAKALVHLLIRGLERPTPSIEVYNVSDPNAGTYLDVLRIARLKGRHRAFRADANAPVVLDLAKPLIKHRAFKLRYPIGMIKYRADKLTVTGFKPVVGFVHAVEASAAAFLERNRAA